MPVTIEETYYTFSELSDEAKERARSWARETESICWDQDDSDHLTEWFKEDAARQGFGDVEVFWQHGGYEYVRLNGPIDFDALCRADHRVAYLSAAIDRMLDGGILMCTLLDPTEAKWLFQTYLDCRCRINDGKVAFGVDISDQHVEEFLLPCRPYNPNDPPPRTDWEKLLDELEELIQDAVDDVQKDLQCCMEREWEYHYSDEYINEMLESNEWLFGEDGGFERYG